MMTFADGWGWASWLILGLIMLMFVIVVGGVGVMFWTAGDTDHEPASEVEEGATPVTGAVGTPPSA